MVKRIVKRILLSVERLSGHSNIENAIANLSKWWLIKLCFLPPESKETRTFHLEHTDLRVFKLGNRYKIESDTYLSEWRTSLSIHHSFYWHLWLSYRADRLHMGLISHPDEYMHMAWQNVAKKVWHSWWPWAHGKMLQAEVIRYYRNAVGIAETEGLGSLKEERNLFLDFFFFKATTIKTKLSCYYCIAGA